MTVKLVIEVYRHNATGRPQVAIGTVDQDGLSDLYRLAGPGFTGTDRNLLSRPLDEADAAEIRRYLDAVFPVTATPPDPSPRPPGRRPETEQKREEQGRWDANSAKTRKRSPRGWASPLRRSGGTGCW